MKGENSASSAGGGLDRLKDGRDVRAGDDDRAVGADEHRALVLEGFTRQAHAFARSPLKRSPERLRRLLRFAGPKRGDLALDVACGPGILSEALAAHVARSIGIDMTGAMIEEARRGGDATYLRGDAERLPFRDGVFDLVVCRDSLHHLFEPARCVNEMTRVVRPGGRVVIEDMRALEDPDDRARHETIERLRDSTHVRSLTVAELRSLAAAAGLRAPWEEFTTYAIDFDEWIERAYPTAERRARVQAMMEACIEDGRGGHRVWRHGGRLCFERRGIIFGATRP